MMALRHLIIGAGTAGLNCIRTIREEDGGASELTLVAAERPYSRMVLPYYLDRSIAESHVFTATAATLAAWKVTTHIGKRAAGLDPRANTLTLDDGTTLEYDDCLIATGSRAVKAPVPGADLPGIHSFWTLDQAREVISGIGQGSHVVMVGAGFIAFTILNSILSLGAKLTIVEIAPRILPRMVDEAGAAIVEAWLKKHGVRILTGATLTRIEEARGKKRLKFRKGSDLLADLVIMATGIKPNLEWLQGSGIRMNHGILVDDHLRSSVPNVYAAGDVAEGKDGVTGVPVVHAIEPTAMEHGRVVGANMAGRDVAYRGSLNMNIVEVCRLDVASFGAWDDPKAEGFTGVRPDRSAYRKLCWSGDQLTGAIIIGQAGDIWTTNDVGMLKGLVQTRVRLGAWKEHLRRNPFDLKPAFIASRTTAQLLPDTILGRPSRAPELPTTVTQ
jgi:NAD(P)H-nitrite reductase large subunit